MMKKRFASGAEKRAVKRRFQEAGAEQMGTLDSFLQKSEDESSEKTVGESHETIEKDSDITENKEGRYYNSNC